MENLKATTVINWGKRPEHLAENMAKCLEKYTYLQEEKYAHKKEQLYLMIQQGRSGKFVNAFFSQDMNISSMDLDFLRSIALLTGEEFVLEHFFKKEFSLETAKRILEDYFSEKRYEKFPKIETLVEEGQRMQEQLQKQIAFLDKEREQGMAVYQEMLKKDRRAAELEKKLAEQELQAQIQQLKQEKMAQEVQIEKLLEEKRAFERENEGVEENEIEKSQEAQEKIKQFVDEYMQSVCQEMQQKITDLKQQDLKEREAERGSYFSYLKKKRTAEKLRQEKEERNRFVLEMLSDPRFSKEQMEVLIRLTKRDVPLPKLKQICDPKLEVKNLEMLEVYFGKETGRIDNPEEKKV